MIEEDEEETLISKNSPLYSYLVTTDSADNQAIKIEKEALLEQIQEENTVATISENSRKSNGRFGRFLAKIRQLLSKFNAFHRNGGRRFSSNAWTDQWQISIIDQLLNSKLLDEDDETILRAEVEIISSRSRSGFAFRRGDTRPKLPRRYFIPILAAIPYAMFRYYSDSHPLLYFTDAVAIGGAIRSGFPIWKHYRFAKISDRMEDVLERCKAADTTFRKALRTIREYEVLARGYTVVTKYTVVMNKASPEPDDVVPCLQLRKNVFLAAESLFTYFRSRTLEVTRRSKDDLKSMDSDESFLLAETDELKTVFGDYSKVKNWRISLSVLQGCCYCMTLQRSELLRVLALNSDPNQFNRLLADIVETVTKCEESVKRTLLYYISFQPVEEPSSTRNDLETESTSPIYDYVHSMSLHLRLALERTTQFEAEASNMPSLDKFREDLASTLKKCQACLDELQTFVDGEKKKGASEDGEPNSPLQPPETPDECQTTAPRIYDGTEPEIVDQVFEAFTNSDDRFESSGSLEYHPDLDNCQFISGRRHVLDELKSVLTVRSSAMHERELKALAARRGVTIEDLLAEEESQRLKEEEEEKRRREDEARTQQALAKTNHDNLIKSDIGGGFAFELARAMKGFNRGKEEIVLGDDEDEEVCS